MILAGTVKTEMPPLMTAAPIVPDATAGFVRWVALIAAAVLLFISWAEVTSSTAAEYYGCLLVAAAGVAASAPGTPLTELQAAAAAAVPTNVRREIGVVISTLTCTGVFTTR